MKYKNILVVIAFLEFFYVIILFFYPIQNQIVLFNRISSSNTKLTQEDPSQAYNPAILKKIALITPLALSSAILKNEYTGTVISIQKDVKKINLYPLIFKLRGLNNLENAFLLTQKDVLIMQVFHKKIDVNNASSIDDVNTGDVIKVYEEIDLFQPWTKARRVFTMVIQ